MSGDYHPDEIVAAFAKMVRRSEALREFGQQILRRRAQENEADAIGSEIASLIYQREPNPNRRAAIWLIGRQWIDTPCDASDPRTGARAMRRWVRAVLAQPRY